MDQRRKIFWLYVFAALAFPALAFGIWNRGFKPGDQWIIGAVGISVIARLIWAWRQQRVSDKRLCFLCGSEWTPPAAPQKQFLCNECNRLWLIDSLRRFKVWVRQKSN
jgi:hypothetical protein